MTTDVRPLAPELWDLYFDRLARAFGWPASAPEDRELWRQLTETERSLTAWDGEELIGTAGAFSFRMTVPGGAPLAVSGVTMVSVQPTHRRRGVLTAMMRRQLDDFRARGESVAILTASEPAIYGRFGYGVATREMSGTVDTTRVSFAVPEEGRRVRFRLGPAAAALDACEAVYAQVVAGRPGMLARQPGWERKPVLDPPADRDGATELLCVLAELDGEVRGYARYAVKPQRGAGGSESVVRLKDLEALDPAVGAALWQYLADIDLTSSVAFRNRPADDPLVHLVSDLRRCRLGWRDGLHLRLVDVGAALSARTYTCPVDVVLAVEDPFCPWNSGAWRLSGDAEGATCERTTAPADLAVPVRDLGAAYLGGPTLRAMAAAGTVRELRPGALREASAAFHGDVEPWLPHGF
ncbi:GNAT family N-acetyltransferase [Actinacidiphila acididurans]|uniref:GNAT family N-acetyltransferase n=1 Tax=Actinacidiphila acididurans TaxID=2784346 RepID=A0ABS2TYF7_9ACTN|nr:GNAT family N-acetyltransferase [Actinacidiphila acididurans]MBM9508354.1 GNAT family N-acetyltransferase [Actinacidiphila acididurans]